MDVLSVNLENCYGIRKLDETLTFKASAVAAAGSAFSIYAPNGFMKTSLARTFLDIQEGLVSQDMIFPDRPTARSITADPATAITPESIFVIKPYVERYAATNTSTLLVNPKLREEYEESVRNIETTLESLLKELKGYAGWTGRSAPISEIKEVFHFENVYEFFADLAGKLDGDSTFSNLVYTEIFNDKTMAALSSGTLNQQLHEYMEKYQELVEQSPLLSKRFNHAGAADVSKSLFANGFFDAKHSLNISTGGDSKVEVTSAQDFDTLVGAEKQRILGDKELAAKFEAVDKQLQRNAELKKFREYLLEHPELLPELGDYKGFREKLWGAYFNLAKTSVLSFAAAYSAAKDVIARTASQAEAERTKWTAVVAQFNERFYVPFRLVIQNQQDVILKGEAPKVGFEFHDGRDSCSVDEEKLLQVLSQGEKRALYILNILFEIRVRQESRQPTLLVIDDIADSFDYKNKYAIIEYLNEISKNLLFRMIFLTHNFDFHRTISSRLQIARPRRLFVRKRQGVISFFEEKYQKDPFAAWKRSWPRSQILLWLAFLLCVILWSIAMALKVNII